MHYDRRRFLQKSIGAALGGATLLGPLGNLSLINAAIGATPAFNDYKALVCVFLIGGNDGFNTVVPSDSYHSAYAQQRGPLAIAASNLIALNPVAGGMPSDGHTYGLHSSMPEMAALFNTGKAAVIANVGTLLRPITRAEYQSGLYVPPQLFAHNDQQNMWQTSRPDDSAANGWGGRVADLLHAANPPSVPMTMSIAQQFPFLRGDTINQYVTDSGGLTQLSYTVTPNARTALFNTLHQPNAPTNILQRAYAGTLDHTINTYNTIASVLPAPGTYAGFTNSNDGGFGMQMETVARLINASSAKLGMHRQIFFIGVGGYDTHNAQLTGQAALLANLSQNINALFASMGQMNLADQVTIFTASDFGRTLSVNSDGTDHGWGGHHFVVGGAVQGQRFYGTMPSLAATAQNNDDVGWGQIIPTTSVDQYAAPLASWFGVDNAGIATIFPNLGHFAGPLAFMA